MRLNIPTWNEYSRKKRQLIETPLGQRCKDAGLILACLHAGTKKEGRTKFYVWSCSLRNADASEFMTFEFSQGEAHAWRNIHGDVCPAEPIITDVMHSLLSDAQAGEHATFEEFASEFGYDPDSRKAEDIYNKCRESAKDLKRVLGEDFEPWHEAAQDY